MLQEKRFSRIMEYLAVNDKASTEELAKLNGVSIDTVRRDLDVLEKYGVLDRVRGGAVMRRESLEQHVSELRGILNPEHKRQIAQLIAHVVEDGTTVAIGGGSTCAEIAKVMATNYKRLTVITNNLDIVKILKDNEDFKIIIPGGMVDKEENCIFGEKCEEELGMFNADVGIVSSASVSVKKGMSDFRFNIIETMLRIMSISEKVVLAVDSTKFNKSSSMKMCEIKDIDVVISDEGIPAGESRKLRTMGIEVITP